ncbi:MAG: heme exporter protein CcmB [Symbiobacteriia bacterium]
MQPTFFGAVRALLIKDLRLEFHSKEMLSALLIFALLVAVTFSFAFDVAPAGLREVFPGMIWVAFFFAGMLALGRSFAAEKQNGCLQALMLGPFDRTAIYYAKVLGNLLVMLGAEVVLTPLFFIFFDMRLEGSLLMLIAIWLLATFGFIAVGTLLSALAAQARASEILLPIIVFPVITPVIMAAVKSTAGLLLGAALADYSIWLKLLVGYDVIFIALPFILFEYLLEV